MPFNFLWTQSFQKNRSLYIANVVCSKYIVVVALIQQNTYAPASDYLIQLDLGVWLNTLTGLSSGLLQRNENIRAISLAFCKSPLEDNETLSLLCDMMYCFVSSMVWDLQGFWPALESQAKWEE